VNGQVKTDPPGIKLKCMGTEYPKKLKKLKKALFKGKRRKQTLAFSP
jgi:hypothetical protein